MTAWLFGRLAYCCRMADWSTSIGDPAAVDWEYVVSVIAAFATSVVERQSTLVLREIGNLPAGCFRRSWWTFLIVLTILWNDEERKLPTMTKVWGWLTIVIPWAMQGSGLQ